MSIIANEPAEEEEMSIFIAKFSVRMHKWAAGSEGETTPKFGRKRSWRSSLDEEAQKDWAIILVDSLDRAPNDQSALEGVPNEAGASLEEGILVGGPPNVEEIGEKPPLGVFFAPMLPPRPVDTEPSKKRLPN